jgi:hypothetical protein
MKPFLINMLKVLPVWFEIVDRVSGILMKAQDLNLALTAAIGILQLVSAGINFVDQKLSDLLAWGGGIANDIQALPGRIWDFVQRLPSQIGMAISDQLPSIPGSNLFGGDGGGDGAGGSLLSDIRDALGGGDGPTTDSRRDRPIVNLGGGLSAFVDRVERDPNTELQ